LRQQIEQQLTAGALEGHEAEILDHFRKRVHQMGGGNHQILINEALREYIRRGGIEAACAGRYEKSYEGPALSKQRAAEHGSLVLCNGHY
jgi:hypothetical protein